METLDHCFVCSGEKSTFMPKGNAISLFPPIDILELLLITAEERSTITSLEPRRKKDSEFKVTS